MTTNPASQLLETGITLAILPGITAAIDNKAKHACCMNFARDRYMNCYQGRGGFPLLPWEAGYEGVC